VNHDGNRRNRFIEGPYMPERGVYAEETARLIDSEVRRIVSTAEKRATEILGARRETLDTVSARLLVKEVIEGDELRELIGPMS